jgi:WD40 repeat protein
MSDINEAHTPSVAERVRRIDAGAPVVAIHFLGQNAVFALGEEALLFATPETEPQRVLVHGGAILSATSDGERVITGGDDGKVIATDAVARSEPIAQDTKHRWIDRVAIAPNGAVAWSAGKTAFVRTQNGERALDVPSTVGGLAFAPKGFRLAIAHYNGVTLWFPNAAESVPEKLVWKGSHLGVSFNPDGKFLITTMQEPVLHGWRLADRQDLRMSGYSERVRSLAWTRDGRWLATGGSEQLILWPFQAKDGPMGKQPDLLAPLESRVTVVACHPKQDVVAVGYADGTILLVRLDDGAEILVNKPDAMSVTALCWDRSGATLAFGADGGEAGLLTV